MSSTSTRETSPRARSSARWHLVLAVVAVTGLLLEVYLTATGSYADADKDGDVASRLVNLFSYFTIQSNVLVLVTAITLARNPYRTGTGWSVLRLDALLGITVSLLVYWAVLAPTGLPTGLSLVATLIVHLATPALCIVGWVLYGPRPRINGPVISYAMIWPLAWLAYTFVHGAATDWYPYPFLKVVTIGYGRALINCLGVLVFALLLAAGYRALDKRLKPAPDPEHAE